ncbi:uncharacterized protein LOC129577904 [Sitodiplosis mosellana]|uniref:uncharacterized protein LOC129577904 n=1 Tax=Sitodiplosis mosellana TaxID=263140 RepID=UPI0024449979|nr:uncharacterized protein LOC129577904 [Sitodiplosis mosellana]
MLTKKKRIGVDSSPKASVGKNVHLLTKETMQDTVNMISTPTRRNRFMLDHANMMNDDSPVLSQESINISWRWNNEGTPIRPTNKASKLRRSITNNSPHLQNLQRLKRNSSDNQNGTTGAGVLPMVISEPETHSPKGLYKFQEEMRKIQFDIESDTSCDNFNNDKSMTEAAATSTATSDTGYPTNMKGVAQANIFNQHTDARCSDSLDVHMMEKAEPEAKTLSQTNNYGLDDNIADDLLNDSDFDQILLTCKMPTEQKKASETMTTNQMQTSVKKASSAPEIKASGSSNSSGSNWNIAAEDDDDFFDDLVKDFDVDIPSTLNTSAKFTRHKSMPQQPQKSNASSTATKTFVPQQSSYVNSNLNRKSFIRHESMPITNTSISRPSAANNNNHISVKPNSAFSSSQTRKCTSEEIAEKRRQAMERLKSRKQNKANT